MKFVEARVAVQGWIDLTDADADADYWAEAFIGKPVVVMGRDAGFVRETWIDEHGVMGRIELDNSALEAAFEFDTSMAVG